MRKSSNLNLEFLNLGDVVPKRQMPATAKSGRRPLDPIDTDPVEDDSVEFRLVPGLPSYRVGSDGSVWSSKSGRWLKLKSKLNADGYLVVNFNPEAKSFGEFKFYSPMLVHRLVLLAFKGLPPKDHVSCHNNGDKTNNKASNLRWGTDLENARDTAEHAKQGGPIPGVPIVNAEIVMEIRDLRANGARYVDIVEKTGIRMPVVCGIAKGKAWKHVV